MARDNYQNTDPVHIECGISARDQEASFMNATLQDTQDDLTFSIATHITTPPGLSEPELARYLDWILNTMVDAVPTIPHWPGPRVEFTVELGQTRGDDD